MADGCSNAVDCSTGINSLVLSLCVCASGSLLFYAESPPEGCGVHRGWDVPPVRSWRRKRNYVLGATTIVRPSSARPLQIDPPSERPGPCASPGCGLYVHSTLGAGDGHYCCHRCREQPGRHAKGCERRAVATGPAPAWSLAEHGCVDVEIGLSLQLPIPTFLIPLAICRWVIKALVRLVYPRLLALNEQFGSTPFAQRVAADAAGFYRSVREALSEPTRPHVVEQKRGGGPRFLFRGVPALCQPCAAGS